MVDILNMTPDKDAALAATLCYDEACHLASQFMYITDDVTSLSSVVGSMLFAKFCKAEFIAGLGKEHENEGTLFLQEMEEMVDLKIGEFILAIRGKT